MTAKSALGIAALSALLLASSQDARADVIMNFTESGSNVVGTASGSIDLAGLTFAFWTAGGGALYPAYPSGGSFAGLGAPGNPPIGVSAYTTGTISGPTSFGTGGLAFPNSGSGNPIDIATAYTGFGTIIYLPNGYVSGSALSSTSTWNSTTFAALGLTPGTYVYKWGSGDHADSFTVNIGSTNSVPEPGAILLLGTSALALVVRRSRTA